MCNPVSAGVLFQKKCVSLRLVCNWALCRAYVRQRVFRAQMGERKPFLSSPAASVKPLLVLRWFPVAVCRRVYPRLHHRLSHQPLPSSQSHDK